ncbi:signal-transducing adaptor protein 1-like [Takifugu rubripes]|uniref:Signal transducing adaptor family member 2b n=1 Tax=Takifugu rubripes TaxID=31033 RepID=H2VC47_TAKRU|nr:signal-transducing adaptor protein 1-like [Takifugu rubripes]
MMATRTARQRSQLPHCYYEGFLEKRSFKDKTSRKLWACLCGKTLFFFNDKKDTNYIEALDLGGLISVTDDSSPDRNLDAARLNLQMKDGNIKLTVPSAEARELWKGFIHSITELSVPSSVNLLPGQIQTLKEAIEQEKVRMQSLPAPSSDPYVSPRTHLPMCYHNVSRLEAMILLERESKRGNLLLRPGTNGNTFAVTTRQDMDGSIFKHYRVTREHDGSFVIDVENPIPCATLHDVVTFLVEKTEGVLIPLILEEAYEKSISFVWSDNENGEKSVQQAPVNPVPPTVPPKPVPLRLPAPEAAPVSPEDEPIYLNDTLTEFEDKTEDVSASLQPLTEKNTSRKALMPPTPAPRKLSSASSVDSPSSSSPASTSDTNVRTRVNSDTFGRIPLATISELKLKLEKKAQCQD